MKGGNGCSSLKIGSSGRLLRVMRMHTNGKVQARDWPLTFNVLAFKRPQPPAGRSFSGI